MLKFLTGHVNMEDMYKVKMFYIKHTNSFVILLFQSTTASGVICVENTCFSILISLSLLRMETNPALNHGETPLGNNGGDSS